MWIFILGAHPHPIMLFVLVGVVPLSPAQSWSGTDYPIMWQVVLTSRKPISDVTDLICCINIILQVLHTLNTTKANKLEKLWRSMMYYLCAVLLINKGPERDGLSGWTQGFWRSFMLSWPLYWERYFIKIKARVRKTETPITNYSENPTKLATKNMILLGTM